MNERVTVEHEWVADGYGHDVRTGKARLLVEARLSAEIAPAIAARLQAFLCDVAAEVEDEPCAWSERFLGAGI